jgi:hypothetical protein
VFCRATAGPKGSDAVTVNVPGAPTLCVVGVANFVTGTAGRNRDAGQSTSR